MSGPFQACDLGGVIPGCLCKACSTCFPPSSYLGNREWTMSFSEYPLHVRCLSQWTSMCIFVNLLRQRNSLLLTLDGILLWGPPRPPCRLGDWFIKSRQLFKVTQAQSWQIQGLLQVFWLCIVNFPYWCPFPSKLWCLIPTLPGGLYVASSSGLWAWATQRDLLRFQ